MKAKSLICGFEENAIKTGFRNNRTSVIKFTHKYLAGRID